MERLVTINLDDFYLMASRIEDRTTISVIPLTFGRARINTTPAEHFETTLGTPAW